MSNTNFIWLLIGIFYRKEVFGCYKKTRSAIERGSSITRILLFYLHFEMLNFSRKSGQKWRRRQSAWLVLYPNRQNAHTRHHDFVILDPAVFNKPCVTDNVHVVFQRERDHIRFKPVHYLKRLLARTAMKLRIFHILAGRLFPMLHKNMIVIGIEFTRRVVRHVLVRMGSL